MVVYTSEFLTLPQASVFLYGYTASKIYLGMDSPQWLAERAGLTACDSRSLNVTFLYFLS